MFVVLKKWRCGLENRDMILVQQFGGLIWLWKNRGTIMKIMYTILDHVRYCTAYEFKSWSDLENRDVICLDLKHYINSF
jgi:hypothetical protein